ncbi:unnamed protein product [Caenorhabditis angaria]|uniref:C2H2-type domain-containing protein n=1 Tax=Caenorhabditis angaria TaxID=860376 RepID=A0A9P1IAP4_9PELO|nr:unnamed protein product [Caenorhabditis angaria]
MRNMDQFQLKMILNAMTSPNGSSSNVSVNSSATPIVTNTSSTTNVHQLINNNIISNNLVGAAGDDTFTRQLVALQQLLCLQQQQQQQPNLNSLPALQPSPVTPSLQLSYFSPTTNGSSLISNTLIKPPTPPETFSISSILNLPVKPAEPLKHRKLSSPISPQDIVGLLCPPPPVLTPNSTISASSPSVSLASTSSKVAEEEEDCDLFVDVESVDTTIDGKDRRKAHVEFYRKMKSMRQRERQLTCVICNKKMENTENTIQTHISEHANAGGYQCRICGWQSNDKYRIYEHMRKDHPRKVDMFCDKRDMPKMCNFLSQCFPRSTTRPKKESDKNAERFLDDLMQNMEKCQQFSRPCRICNQQVKREKLSIIRHVQTNHTLKCKICKIITVSIEEQLEHQKEVHSMDQPKMSVHYAPSAAAVFLFPSLEKCFPIKCC